jgi:hypothetical protein
MGSVNVRVESGLRSARQLHLVKSVLAAKGNRLLIAVILLNSYEISI